MFDLLMLEVDGLWSSHLSRGSSPVDWCEDNYTHSPMIAEFFNTVSNALFFVVPPLLMHLHRGYARRMGPGIQVIWALLVVVGFSSAYFHATLSLLGQLLDEMAILWVVMAGVAMWYPKGFMPAVLKDREGRKTFTVTVLVLTLVSTYLGFLEPTLNAFFLMTLGLPSVLVLAHNLSREEEPRVTKLGRRSIVYWILSVACWLSDKLCCDLWSNLGFPYLHGIWHVLIFLASYSAVVLLAYFDVKHNHPQERAVVRYWPVDAFEYGVSYVTLKGCCCELNGKDQKI